MDKKQWQVLYQELSSIHSDLRTSHYGMSSGSPKARKASSQQADFLIEKADRLLFLEENSQALYLLLSKGHTVERTEDAADRLERFMRKFKIPRDLYVDMKEYLEIIKTKIDSFDSKPE
ncbi:hypothetical protein [Fibrivirga algicola]|uniref:Uncharacterized protein n=1 Tax=Fibrivirga algicola TaxID=2950420 RepID=A0ABX0QRX4_9BACT|nr:hypothetical protein [Fibrivirga algicola]NID13513.1 hypothetical protein [Fibrivirga algicola]